MLRQASLDNLCTSIGEVHVILRIYDSYLIISHDDEPVQINKSHDMDSYGSKYIRKCFYYYFYLYAFLFLYLFLIILFNEFVSKIVYYF